MKRILLTTAIALMASAAVFADIARPEPPKSKHSVVTNMSIRLDADATEAVLIIPKSQVKQLRAQLDQMDDDTGNTAEVVAPGSISRTQTIVSGMFLSLAIVFGGIWFARSGKSATKTGKTLVALMVVAGAASAVTLVYANAGPPPEARTINGKMFSEAVHMYRSGWGQIRLETSNDDHVTLVVPDPPDKANSGE